MAINTNTPIIPIFVKGGFRFKPKNRWYIKPSIIEIEVGDVIDVSKYSIDNIDSLVNKTYNLFKKKLEE